MSDQGDSFFKAIRSEEATELVARNPNAFILLYIIASRAQRTSAFNRYNLTPGEALIGDYEAYGMTEKNYRTAKEQLQKFNFAAFKGTSKGTIATLINSRVFNINIEKEGGQSGEQGAEEGRTGGEQGATTKNDKKDKNEIKREAALKVPTLDEVKALFENNDAEAEKFYDHYESNGWKVGKNPMRSVPATIRTWKRRSDEYRNNKTNKPNNRNTGIAPDASYSAKLAAKVASQQSS